MTALTHADNIARELVCFSRKLLDNNILVKTYGNVMSAAAFLHGITKEELKREELDFYNQDYQLLIVVRVVKRARRHRP